MGLKVVGYDHKYEDDLKAGRLKVYVVIATQGGVLCLDDVGVFLSKESAKKDEERLCKALDVPFDEKERERYYDGGGEETVDLLEIEVHD